ncbi:Pup deamidase/depupylase [Rubripirellula amarantea]|uniref:Pup deamidase/depupylase n=1 Tax=Rubripirellula amarantea TaxID=2527999 RepID=A0A5C5WXW4_9BACT|nr:proteasome accessory factor PafA2 family protein [Rubripirellula amarantea]TWT54735.1 Pup deamidase/depupylase [Rubripirellula amarantea]
MSDDSRLPPDDQTATDHPGEGKAAGEPNAGDQNAGDQNAGSQKDGVSDTSAPGSDPTGNDRDTVRSGSRKAKAFRLDRPLVSRLIGLETEYATLVNDPQNLDREDLPPARLVFEQICEAVQRDQPTVGGLFDSEQLFLASGGAISFESHPSMHSAPGGLVEIATPEVRNPTELLSCQRSIDELASEATFDSETSFDLRILKNSSDALGHVYGCQENYEAEVATGWLLVVYRGFIALLWCMQVISLMVAMPIMLVLISLVGISRLLKSRKDKLAQETEFHDFDDDPLPLDNRDVLASLPTWVSGLLIHSLRLVHLPTVLVLGFVAKHIAFRKQRHYLAPMLISRVALCGAGNLDPDGCYHLSPKAMAIDSVSHMGGFRGERPIFVFGHWLAQFCAKSFLSLTSTRSMFAKRQRLQIGLSDSNMSDLAEYVKVASVSLVLDMIECGYVEGLPIIRQPVESLHRISSDWNLVSRVPTSRGEMTALDIQKVYLNLAKRFVDDAPANMLGDAKLVLYRWQELFDAANAFRQNANDIDMAIGRVDWLTKRNLIDSLGEEAHWTDRKKVDLRYHELSEEGYYSMLMESRPDLRLVTAEQIDRRRRSPPAGSPAARRGWLIREFAGSDEPMQSEWAYAVIGRGRKRRRVDFAKES